MVEYRAFRNSDPPLLAEVWRAQASQRGLMQPMSASLFESHVLSKPIFDRHGLIVALEDSRAVGFVHAGFGPTPDQGGLSTDIGVTSMLMVRSPSTQGDVVDELLARGEQYLRASGAQTLYGGGIRTLDPFYLGLYGGSRISGILLSDECLQEVFAGHGYQQVSRTSVFQSDLTRFRPIVDRRQMQIRRRTVINMVLDPPPRNWWEACTLGGFDRTRFDLVSRDTATQLATVSFWNMQPLSTTWGVQAAGLIDLELSPHERRQGLATYLIGEAFRQLQSQGVSLVEVQAQVENQAAAGLFKKLGFEEVDQTAVYRKD